MKSYASVLAGCVGVVCAAVLLNWLINSPADPVATRLIGFGCWIMNEINPEIRFEFLPKIIVSAMAGGLAYSVSFFGFWRLEMWGAGLSSRNAVRELGIGR